jgi:NADH-quinone oxidoreductase subunit N
MKYLDLLRITVPETIVVVCALATLLADSTMRRLELRFRFMIGGMIACAGCAAAIAWMLLAPGYGGGAQQSMLSVDPLVQFVKIAILVLTVFTVLISLESDFTEHVGEYFALILLGAVGMMFLAGSEDILMLFISLELTSLSLYILAAFNKRDVKSAEAALKYFLFGGMSAAFTLFGLSLIYGLSGQTNLRAIAAVMAGKGLDPLLAVAMVMVVIGFGFKVAAAPFHLWAPDAYQGAPTPSAAFIASGSKVLRFRQGHDDRVCGSGGQRRISARRARLGAGDRSRGRAFHAGGQSGGHRADERAAAACVFRDCSRRHHARGRSGAQRAKPGLAGLLCGDLRVDRHRRLRRGGRGGARDRE